MMEERRKVLRLLKFYNARTRDDSLDLTSFVFRSACYEYLEEYRWALRDALKITGAEPTYWKGHLQAMRMHIKLGHISEAERIAEEFKENDLFRKTSLVLDTLKEVDKNISQTKNEKSFNRELAKARDISPGCRKYKNLTFEKSKKISMRSNSAPKLTTNSINDQQKDQPEFRRRTNSNDLSGNKKQSRQAFEDESMANLSKEGKCSIS